MFVRCKTRHKDGKEHRYWSVVENVRVRGGRVVQRQVLYLGEINDSHRAVSAPFRKCMKTAVVEVLVTYWHLLRYLFDSLSSSPPDGFGRALHPPCARHFQTGRLPTISRRR